VKFAGAETADAAVAGLADVAGELGGVPPVVAAVVVVVEEAQPNPAETSPTRLCNCEPASGTCPIPDEISLTTGHRALADGALPEQTAVESWSRGD